MRLGPTTNQHHFAPAAAPPAHPRVLPPPAPHRPALARHSADDRCRARDLFCPQPTDPKAPIRFSAYLEKQNRERPEFTLKSPTPALPRAAGQSAGDRPPPATDREPAVRSEPCPCAPSARAPAATDPARIGDVFPTPAPTRTADVTIHYVIHRPIPSGMTIDVFA